MFKPIVLAALLATTAGVARAAPVESFAEIPVPPGALKATILSPEGGARGPAVVILPGSGPTDRDGNNPLGVRGATYRRLAEGLAAQGVTTLRMDKRGMFASGGAAANPNAVTVDMLAADANAWAAKLKAETGAECVWLLGHSEGGLVALIAAQSGKDLCGLILVSTSGTPYGEVLRAQVKKNPANPPEIVAATDRAIDELTAGRKVDPSTLPAPLLNLFHPAIQDFLIATFRHDPAALARAYEGPILIVQGSTDLQITVADANVLKAAQPSAKLVVLEGVNHVLKVAPADRAANIATYSDPSLPLAPGLAEAIAAFVKGQPGTN